MCDSVHVGVSKHCDNLRFRLISTISNRLRHHFKLYITVFLSSVHVHVHTCTLAWRMLVNELLMSAHTSEEEEEILKESTVT